MLQEASTAMSAYGGTIGRVVGSVVSGVGNQVRSAKSTEVKLIDNQTVILKIVENEEIIILDAGRVSGNYIVRPEYDRVA